jgi:hypothetical protein
VSLWSDRRLQGDEIEASDVADGSSLDGRLSKLIARNLSSELMMPVRLTFAGGGRDHERALDSGQTKDRGMQVASH